MQEGAGYHPPGYHERDAMIRQKEEFAYQCLVNQDERQKVEQTSFEEAITGLEDERFGRVSSESAQHLYATRLALTTLYEQGAIPSDMFFAYLSLGHDLMDQEGRKGIIPAIVHLKRIEGAIPRVLLYSPDFFFTDPVIDYLLDHQPSKRTKGGGKKYISAVEQTLLFANSIYEWNTAYLRKNQDVGVIDPQVRIESKGKQTREIKRQKAIRGPEANYLVYWRGVPFKLYQELTSNRILDWLPSGTRRKALHRIIVEQQHELLYGGYYNPDLLEKIPRKGDAMAVLRSVKEEYGTASETDPAIRENVNSELRELLRELTDNDYPLTASERHLLLT